MLWISVLAVHVAAYLWRTLRWIADDWRKQPAEQASGGRGFRLSVSLGSLLVGLVAALLLFHGAAPWIVWSQIGQKLPDKLIEGLIIAVVVLLVVRPFRWR